MIDYLGKLLYPRLQRWDRRRKMNQIILTVLGVIVLVVLVVVVSFSRNKLGH